MTFPPAISKLLRRAARWLAALAALAALGAAAAAGLMYFWVLPNIADHRDTVAGLMSRALGQRVTLEAVSGVWQQARPEFRLLGVRLYDQQGQPALHLPQLDAAFAWRSLLFLEPRFNRIELQGLTLGVRRARDGHLYVGGIPVNPADPDSGFSNWLLRQGRVHAGKATLTWLDEVRDAPPLVLREVDFTLANTRHAHRLTLRAVPPATLARPLTITADISSRNTDDIKTWSGRVDASLAGVSLPRLATWLALPYPTRQGWGALNMTFTVTRGEFAGVAAGFDLREIETRFGDDLPALQLAQVRGQARWQRGPDGQRIAFENLRVARPGGTLGVPFNAGLAWSADSRELTARSLNLGVWQSVLPSLPLDATLRERLQALQPQGRLDEFRLGWRGAQPGRDNFSIAAHFSGLGVASVDAQPALANLTGRIEGDARAGAFEVDSEQLIIKLPALFREPSFGFDRARARGSWKKSPRGLRLTLSDAAFANPDLAGTVQGDYELIAGHPGIIDLTAHLSRAEATAVHRYFPKIIGDHTVDWVRESVVAGHSDDVRLNLKGDLTQFPFEQGNGTFSVDLQVKDGVIDYVQGWPRIEGIQARVLFRGKRMEVTASQARIYGASLLPVKAVIPDLLHHNETLLIEGQAGGPAQDFIRFANFSPVGERLRGFTDALEGSGPMRLTLNLQVPLRRSHDTRLTGRLSFLGNVLFPAGLPRLDRVRGDIDFTHASLNAKNLTAQFLGGPLRVDAATRNGQVQFLAQGSATAAGIVPWLGAAWDQRLSGQTAWRGQVDMEPTGERIRIESDLVGLGSSLPLPLAKAAAQPLPLLVSSQPQRDGRLHEVRLGNTVGALWRSTAGGGFDRGEIRFGGLAVMPPEPGLRLAGDGRALDISGWAALLSDRAGGDTLPLTSLDLDFDALDLMGRRYLGMNLQGRVRNGLLRLQVTGREVNGALTYRPAGTQSARVSAQFTQLTVPERAPAAGAAGSLNMKAANFPILDVTVEDFRLQERSLGRLEVLARGAAEGMVIDNLQLTHPDSVFRMSGLWRDGAPSETRAELDLKVLDAGKFLTRFGYADALRRGSAEIRGNATWVGSPADFSFDTLAGQLDFKARGGQFLKIDPGAGKLLGVLSLQSLPRRLSFDFRDIFNAGYAFDDIGATLRIARGVVYSDDFRMRGPSAKVNMSGLADLNQESVQLRVKVIPKLSEGVAVAGALLGGPLAGVGALAAQKLLRDPFEEAISQEYLVSGAWQSPDVKKLSKAKTENPSGTRASEP
ncbi:MAG: TIGR02099 family protein [Gammaproteobacteria bacterium]|nr:TIGR02099 family protein [Gammaproteobacteria bacterium]MBU1407494.1 TIGR02099 family protein [Gammaproteobacteria bacterium]MBU1531607.1 TIGR02099 family protein [Gammaproteobacteria bacterium]